ncbi:glycosyltransferase [Priestia megaterium]|uniref:glycosyltransferase n=1 Tax=Priestia megaterium TaxID=1404 RepID=UPI003D0488ED
MVIFVNATAASEIGGLKTIVDQFIDNISLYDAKNEYYIFISPLYKPHNVPVNCKLIKKDAKKAFKRLYWDYFGMKNWSEKHNIIPQKIISLQNTGVFFKGVQQTIYLHTPIPFVSYNWSIFKNDERPLWFYKKIYPYFIRSTLSDNTNLIVQSNWLSDSVSKFFNISKERILVNMPSIYQYSNNSNKETDINSETELYFYPAADYKYKNHKIIIEALKLLKVNNDEKYKNVRVVFTLENTSSVYKLAKDQGVLDSISFIGKLNRAEMSEMYQVSKAILFPSYIETFGLPLIEAASFGKSIYCSEEEYSNEVIGSYKGVEFINPFEAKDWQNVFNYEYKEYEPFTHNQNYESWKELFGRINNEKC